MGKLNHHTLCGLESVRQLSWLMFWRCVTILVTCCRSAAIEQRVIMGRELGLESTRYLSVPSWFCRLTGWYGASFQELASARVTAPPLGYKPDGAYRTRWLT